MKEALERKDWKKAGQLGAVKLLPRVVSKGCGNEEAVDELAAVDTAADADADAVVDVDWDLAFSYSAMLVAMTVDMEET